MNRPRPRGPAGFTLVEMLLALAILGVITTAALAMLRTQVRTFASATQRMYALQNLRYAANMLEKDLRTAGSGVPVTQPFLVFAGGDAVAFNADYVSNVANDPFAVYSDTTAPDEETFALPASRAITIPGTSISYPDTSYYDGGAPSPAETILFFFEPDTLTARTDDFVLRRRVNDAAPELVARDLLRTGDAPFFGYLELLEPPDTLPSIQAVPQAALPLRHVAPLHGSSQDTGAVALIDRVRAVRLEFTATNGRSGEDERRTSISRLIRLPNAGLAVLKTCGDSPLFESGLAAEVVATPDGPAIELTWDAATDETAGEADVIRYVLWRRADGEPYRDPFLSVPAGNDSYTYTDTRVDPGDRFTYGVRAQDCTPSLSAMAESPTVDVP